MENENEQIVAEGTYDEEEYIESPDMNVEGGDDLRIIERVQRKLQNQDGPGTSDLDRDIDQLKTTDRISEYKIVPLSLDADSRPLIEKASRDYFFSECNYEGDIVNDRNEGKGVFTFSNGNRYEGDFKDGMFHGKGVIYFPTGSRYEGEWDMGREVSGRYMFNDNLEYKNPAEWGYCCPDDRRLWTEIVSERNKENGQQTNLLEGIQSACPDGKQIDHLKKKGVIRKIPVNCYDTGEGYFSMDDKKMYNYDGSVADEQPNEEEQYEIQKKYRIEC